MAKILRFNELNEYKNNQDLIVEMAKINGNELPYLVYVYGGNSYGAGRKERVYPVASFGDQVRPKKILYLFRRTGL